MNALLVLASLCVVKASVVHYAPESTHINDLTFVLNGTGAPGIYNSSQTPDNLYGIYNWCNMPHVRKQEYKSPSSQYTLEYVEVIQRHQKRTPYASNTFFEEDVPWSCTGEGPVYYGKSATGLGSDVAVIQWEASSDTQNPFSSSVGPGFVGSDCQFPQISDGGLIDSHIHGADLRAVYANRLGFGNKMDTSTIKIRVTNNVITSQVAGGLVKGLFPASEGVPVAIQSDSYDSLEPAYSCPNADLIHSAYTTGSVNWTAHLNASAELYQKLDSVSGIATDDDAGWHSSFDHYYDNFSAKQCHGKALPCSVNDTSLCVTQDEADTVYRLGNWEYSYYYRDAENSTLYSALHYGAWFLELQAHLQAKINGSSEVKYFHNIAHDGSIAPALGFLQVSEMVWPGMGSEIVFELYEKKRAYYIRILWKGQPMETSTPMGTLDMIPIQTFFDYIDSMIGSGSDLFNACNN